jgi:hypothetical protein
MIFYLLFYFVNCCSNITNNNNTKTKTTTNTTTNTNKIVNTIATFYFRVGQDITGCPQVQTFNDNKSYGPCNFNGSFGVKYTKKSKYWAAIKNAKSYCGKNIIVYYNNRNIILKIMDECPGCYKDNHVDMGLDALVELTGSKENACAIHKPLPRISWKFIS